MKEFFRFWLLNRVIKNPLLTAEIYQMMYQNRVFTRPIVPQVEVNTVSSVSVKPSSSNRRRELITALTELKSKSFKTKQDKESIGMLEAALKNVK